MIIKILLSILFLLSITVNAFLIQHYNVLSKVMMRIENFSGKPKHSEYLTSPYIGFTSFYKAVSELYPKDVDLLFLGDSMTERADMRFFYPDLSVVCQGIGGDTTEGMLHRLEFVERCNPKNIIIQVGINDLLKNVNTDIVLQNYKMIVSKLQETIPNADIYIESVYPITRDFENNDEYLVKNDDIVELNHRIKTEIITPPPDRPKNTHPKKTVRYIDVFQLLADENGYLPIASSCDGLHLMGEQYKGIALLVLQAIEQQNHNKNSLF